MKTRTEAFAMQTDAHEILNLMDFWRHCHECGALLVTVPGGAVCAHCGFELEDPDPAAVRSLHRRLAASDSDGAKPDAWPDAVFDEVA